MCAKAPQLTTTAPVNPPPAPTETVGSVQPSSASPDRAGIDTKRRGRSSLRIVSDTGTNLQGSTGLSF